MTRAPLAPTPCLCRHTPTHTPIHPHPHTPTHTHTHTHTNIHTHTHIHRGSDRRQLVARFGTAGQDGMHTQTQHTQITQRLRHMNTCTRLTETLHVYTPKRTPTPIDRCRCNLQRWGWCVLHCGGAYPLKSPRYKSDTGIWEMMLSQVFVVVDRVAIVSTIVSQVYALFLSERARS
jgi:hypothetical protein